MTATNLTVAGKRTVVAGYGWCGKGVAMSERSWRHSRSNEVDPIKAIEARMDGFEVMPMVEAVKTAEIVITVTGCKDVIKLRPLPLIKGRVRVCNAGHFDNEISKKALDSEAVNVTRVKNSLTSTR